MSAPTETLTLDAMRVRVAAIGFRHVADQAKLTHRTISKFATGSPVQTDTLDKIAKALNIIVLVNGNQT